MSDLGEHIEAVRRDPASAEAAAALRSAAKADGAFEAYAAAFAERGKRLAELEHSSDAIDSLVEAALIYEEELENLEAAAHAYQSVLDIQDDHRRALFALGLLLHDLGSWDALIELYRKRLQTSRDPGERTTLHLYIAELLSERKGDDNAAFEEVMAAARLAPRNIRIISRLEKLGESTGRIDEVAVSIGDIILHQEDPRVRAALSLRLAELHLGPIGNHQRALAYLRAALADDGGNPEILSEIEDVFRERKRFDELAEVLEDTAKDRRVGPHRVRLERELARIYELELGDLPRALHALTRATRHAPNDRELLDEVMRLGLMCGDLAAVADTYEEVVDQTDNTLLKTYMRLKLGHIYANVLARLDDAVRVYWEILDDEPMHKEARRRLARIHEKRGDREALARLLELDADELGSMAEAIPVLERLAEIRAKELGQPDRALDAYRRLIEVAPNHPAAKDALLQEERARSTREIRLVDHVGSSVIETRSEAATEFEGEPFGPESETHFEPGVTPTRARRPPPPPSVLDLSLEEADDPVVIAPPPPPPLEEEDMTIAADDHVEAIELLEDLVDDEEPVTPQSALIFDDPAEPELPVPDPFARLGARVGPPPPPPAEELEAAPPPSPPPPPALPDDLELGAVADPGEDAELPPELDAFETGAPSTELGSVADPSEEEAEQSLELDTFDADAAPSELGEAPVAEGEDGFDDDEPATTADPRPLEALFQEALDGADDSSEAEAEVDAGAVADADPLATRLAEIQRELEEAGRTDDRPKMIELLEEVVKTNERLQQVDRAFLAMTRLVKLDPSSERIEDTLRLGRRAEAWPMLVDVVQTVAQSLPQEAQVRFNLSLVDVELEDLKDPSAALRRLEKLAKLVPDDEAILGRRLSLLDQLGKSEDIVSVLVARSEAISDTREALPFVQRAVGVCEQKLDDPGRAADLLMRFLKRAPDQAAVRAQVAELLDHTGRYVELVELLRAGLARVEGEERSEVRLELSRVYLEKLGDLFGAESMLRAGLEERAMDPKLLEALQELYERSSRWADLIDIAERRLELLRSTSVRTELRKKIARVAETELGHLNLALDMLISASAEDPDDVELLDHIERMRRVREDWDGVLEVLRRKAALAAEPEARAALWVSAAEILAGPNGDLDGAAEALEHALEASDHHIGALSFLAEVEERRGDSLRAIAVLRRLAEGTVAGERAALGVRIGRILEERLRDPEGARHEYEAAFEADDHSLPAVKALLAIAEREGDFIRAHDLAVRAAELTEVDRDRGALWRRAGQLAAERIGDELGALASYEKALAADPDDLATCATVGEMLLARQEHERALPHLKRAAKGLSDPERTATLHLAVAEAADVLGQVDEAIEAYEAVLVRAPHRFEPLDRLGVRMVERGDWQRAYDLGTSVILHHEAKLAPRERAPVYYRMALAKRHLGELEASTRLAKKSLQLEPQALPTLALLADVLAEGGDAFEAAECLKRSVPLLPTKREKRDALVRAGNLLGEEDPARAAAMLGEAQALVPEDLEVGELLARYRERIGDAVAAAEALVLPAQSLDGRAKVEVLVRAARILMGAGRERPRARALYQEALELVPADFDARDDLAVLLEFDGELDELAALAERTAEAFLDGDPDEDSAGRSPKVRARSELETAVDLYRFRLDAPERALAVTKRLLELAPEESSYRELHARLLDEVAERDPKSAVRLAREAAGAWARLVEREPGWIEGLRHLFAWRVRAGEKNLARVVAEILEELGETPPALPANDDDTSMSPMSTQVIAALSPVEVPFHPAEDSPLGELFEGLGLSVVRAFSDALPEPRPRRRDLVGAAGLGIHVSRPMSFAARVLGRDTPPVYVRDDAPQAVAASYVGDEPALIVSLVRAAQHSPDELRFLIGHAMSLTRPRALGLAIVPLEILRDGLVGFAKSLAPDEHFADAKLAKRRGRALEKAIPNADRGRLLELTAKWLATPGRASLGHERDAVLRTAERVGLVVAGSLVASTTALRSLSGGPVGRAQRVPLIEFAATRQYAEMIRRMG